MSVDRTWVFGYGSLVAPDSIASTLQRPVARDDGYLAAHLHGFGRRWNYGSLHLRGAWHHDGRRITGGLVVSLGLVSAAGEVCNGAMITVDDAELALLDWRERDYERTDVTDRIVAEVPVAGRVFTYVPRPSAVARYEQWRDEGRAAIRRSYWELVHQAFDTLGDLHLDMLRATPAPDVPVVDIDLDPL